MWALTVNVLCLVDVDLANSQLAIGSLGSAVTTRKVVDDEGGDLIAANVLDVVFDLSNLGASVAGLVRQDMVWKSLYLHPEICADRSDLSCLCLQRAVGD